MVGKNQRPDLRVAKPENLRSFLQRIESLRAAGRLTTLNSVFDNLGLGQREAADTEETTQLWQRKGV